MKGNIFLLILWFSNLQNMYCGRWERILARPLSCLHNTCWIRASPILLETAGLPVWQASKSGQRDSFDRWMVVLLLKQERSGNCVIVVAVGGTTTTLIPPPPIHKDVAWGKRVDQILKLSSSWLKFPYKRGLLWKLMTCARIGQIGVSILFKLVLTWFLIIFFIIRQNDLDILVFQRHNNICRFLKIHAASLEDIRDSTHTPKQEVQHMRFTFDIVSGENVYQWHICYKCAADRHDFLDVLLTWKVLTQLKYVKLVCCDGIRVK